MSSDRNLMAHNGAMLMQFPKEFLSGFASAVHSLGQEGDQRGVDWSEPYKYLKGMLDGFTPEKPKDIAGIKIIVSETVAPGTFEIHHANGKVETFAVKV